MSERKDADTSDVQLETLAATTPSHDIEEARSESVQDDPQKTERRPGALGRELSEMPPGYYRSVRFIGTFIVCLAVSLSSLSSELTPSQAVSFGFLGAVAGFNLIAPLIPAINNELGSSFS